MKLVKRFLLRSRQYRQFSGEGPRPIFRCCEARHLAGGDFHQPLLSPSLHSGPGILGITLKNIGTAYRTCRHGRIIEARKGYDGGERASLCRRPSGGSKGSFERGGRRIAQRGQYRLNLDTAIAVDHRFVNLHQSAVDQSRNHPLGSREVFCEVAHGNFIRRGYARIALKYLRWKRTHKVWIRVGHSTHYGLTFELETGRQGSLHHIAHSTHIIIGNPAPEFELRMNHCRFGIKHLHNILESSHVCRTHGRETLDNAGDKTLFPKWHHHAIAHPDA